MAERDIGLWPVPSMAPESSAPKGNLAQRTPPVRDIGLAPRPSRARELGLAPHVSRNVVRDAVSISLPNIEAEIVATTPETPASNRSAALVNATVPKADALLADALSTIVPNVQLGRTIEPAAATTTTMPPILAADEVPSVLRSERESSHSADDGAEPNPSATKGPDAVPATITAVVEESPMSTFVAGINALVAPLASDDANGVADVAGAFERVFVEGGPLLPEGLRTLEVAPHRVIEPNGTVRAAFTFRNPGGGTASGFRARFCLPEGLMYIAGSARIDATPLLDDGDGRTALLDARGADIGDIAAGGERRIGLEFSVAQTIENGTPIAIQAAIASTDVAVIGSNIVRLIVRSRPVLQNSFTALALVPVRAVLPGEELALTARVLNSGQSSAHDLMVLLPVPAHTTFSPRSVTVDGHPIVGDSPTVSFGFGRPTVIAPVLAPGASVDIGYRVRIDTPLEDGTPIVAQGTVCSQEVAEFALPPVTLDVPSAASFDGNETALNVECADEVQPGERVRIVLNARNVGTAAARYLSLSIVLPEGMIYTAGSLTIDGASVPDRGAQPASIRPGDLGPGCAVELELTAIVQSPIPDGQKLRPAAKITWSKGERRFSRDIVVRSAPRFPAPFNKIERESPQRVGPGDVVSYTVALANMGTDVATGVRVKLSADPGLEELRVRDGETEITIGDDLTIPLDTLEPGFSRSLRVSARVAGIIEDQKELRLRAALQTDQVAHSELGSQIHVVESRPKFSATTSRIVVDAAALQFKRRNTCRLLLLNEGTDSARNVRATLLLPEELQLEGVDDATRDGDSISFGDIAAGEKREAVFYVRLIGMFAGGEPLAIAARVRGVNVVPFSLFSTELATLAEASFAEGARLTSEPAHTADAGAEVTYTLWLRNSGDGAAKFLTARIMSLTNAVYAQGSTTVNNIALQDYAGTSLLLSEGGLRLADVGAGVEIVASWRAIVNIPLPPGTAIESTASVRWDAVDEFVVAAPPILARSTSALPVIDPELPFSVLGAIAARGAVH